MNIPVDSVERVLDERHDVLYKVRLSALYHRTRENLYDKWDKRTKFFSVVLGAAAISELLLQAIPEFMGIPVKDVLVAISTIATASTLVFGVADRARKHADMASQFGNLEAEIVATDSALCSSVLIAKWESRLATLEAVEPPSNAKDIKNCQDRLNLMYPVA